MNMAAICSTCFTPSIPVTTSSLSSSSTIAPSLVSRFYRWGPPAYRTTTTLTICMAPDEEKLTRRNPLDFPVEWERPKPGRRPDIFPQFSPMKTPLPPPLPYDPPAEDEEEDEENKEEDEEDPDKEDQDK
ncbi:uncharacterized protein [Rutidosis leptorrhynchoides]|uniref:uncharacterized protein n=1 Tax=Rutidosis leptorrhynchoides TaxID=125765 RepID=UPI003A99AD97